MYVFIHRNTPTYYFPLSDCDNTKKLNHEHGQQGATLEQADLWTLSCGHLLSGPASQCAMMSPQCKLKMSQNEKF